jgi:hypothetical protein
MVGLLKERVYFMESKGVFLKEQPELPEQLPQGLTSRPNLQVYSAKVEHLSVPSPPDRGIMLISPRISSKAKSPGSFFREPTAM